MKNLIIRILLICSGMFAVSGLCAQNYPNGLSADSVDPKADSLLFSKMRARMDSVRRNAGRPTVALVLSGGGAKGSAHIGVQKFLEELDIPIDVICGTSMGGLMGGLMAVGYSSSFIDSLLTHQDWDLTLSDKVDNEFITYQRKLHKATYNISVPFHYSKDVILNERMSREMLNENGEIQLGAKEKNFGRSLPSGYIYGFNVYNFLSSLTVGYQDDIDFTELPIPFCCVATDLVSMKAKNWGSGSLKDAMRSTMSIPAMFDPLWRDNMILSDGGTRNNFPVDIARAMGADIVIGVDLSDEDSGYEGINNIGDILSRFITMLGNDTFEKNRDKCDIYIKPDLQGYGMLSFTPEAISSLIEQGYIAAKGQEKDLRKIKELISDDLRHRTSTHVINLDKTSVLINSIQFEGLPDKDAKILMDKIGLTPGMMIDKTIMDRTMSILQGSGMFESITYSLRGTSSPFDLVFNCEKGPVHQLSVGVRADDEEWVSLALGLGLNANALSGPKLKIDSKIGINRMLNVVISEDFHKLPSINFEAKVSSTKPDLRIDEHHKYSSRYFNNKEALYLSNSHWKWSDFKVGIQYTHHRLIGNTPLANYYKAAGMEEILKSSYIGLFFNSRSSTIDNPYYPSKGFSYDFTYNWDFRESGNEFFKPVQSFSLNLKKVFPLAKRFCIIPDFHVRYVLGDDIHLSHNNYVGGAMAGRYIDQQIPFIGFSGITAVGDFVSVLNIDLRTRLFENLYLSLLGGIMKDDDSMKDAFLSFENIHIGAGAEIGYNSIAGPLKAGVHWSDGRGVECTLSLGYNF